MKFVYIILIAFFINNVKGFSQINLDIGDNKIVTNGSCFSSCDQTIIAHFTFKTDFSRFSKSFQSVSNISFSSDSSNYVELLKTDDSSAFLIITAKNSELRIDLIQDNQLKSACIKGGGHNYKVVSYTSSLERKEILIYYLSDTAQEKYFTIIFNDGSKTAIVNFDEYGVR